MFKSHCVVHSLVIRECRWMGRACACMQTFVSRTCESESSKPDARYRFHRSHNMEASQYTRSYNAPSFPYWWATPLLQYLINRSSLTNVCYVYIRLVMRWHRLHEKVTREFEIYGQTGDSRGLISDLKVDPSGSSGSNNKFIESDL